MPADESDSNDRALIYDMDGVLIDSEPLWRRAEIEIFAEVGLTLTEQDCLATQGLRIDEVVRHWLSSAGWTDRRLDDVARSIEHRVGELIREEGQLLPDVRPSIEAARSRRWRIGLASSSSIFLIESVLETFGLREVFEVTCSAENEPFGKPHPAVYLKTAQAMAIEPTRCVAIEDSLNGIISALAARMRCIAIPAREERDDPRFAIATRRLASLDSLGEALDEIEAEEGAMHESR